MSFRHTFSVLVVAAALSILGACSNDQAPKSGAPSSTAPKAPAATQHGVKGATEGSYDDWCGEHAVPESKCTRCDSSLVAAFKATNDWCAEHGLPESQCLKCNPDLKIVRPPKSGGQ